MKPVITRALLGGAGFIFGLGGVLHAAAFFSKASSLIDAASAKGFFGRELKVLWLADSTTLICLALICAFLAFRPDAVSKPMLFLISLVPASTTALLYTFLGAFYAAHLLLLGTVMVFAAGTMKTAGTHLLKAQLADGVSA